MLRFYGQHIATDRLCLFRFVERAIEFSLRDGLSNPSCRNALNHIFHGSFLHFNLLGPRECCVPSPSSRLATPPIASSEVSCAWLQTPAFLTTTLCFFR